MQGKSSAASRRFLALLYQAVPWPGVADAPKVALDNVYYALHVAEPSPTGNQSYAETDYPGYARQALSRSKATHVFKDDGAIAPGRTISFPPVGPSGNTEQALTHFSTGTSLNGGGEVWHMGQLDYPLFIRQRSVPQLTTDTVIYDA